MNLDSIYTQQHFHSKTEIFFTVLASYLQLMMQTTVKMESFESGDLNGDFDYGARKGKQLKWLLGLKGQPFVTLLILFSMRSIKMG